MNCRVHVHQIIKLPISWLVFVSGVDRLADMFCTALNIIGAAVTAHLSLHQKKI